MHNASYLSNRNVRMLRNVGSGLARGVHAHPEFGRSVNTISTRGRGKGREVIGGYKLAIV